MLGRSLINDRRQGRWMGLAFGMGLVWLGLGAPAQAQEPPSVLEAAQVIYAQENKPSETVAPTTMPSTTIVDSQVVQVGCPSCGDSGLLSRSSRFPRGCGSCGNGYDGCAPCGACIPGREPCCCINHDTAIGRFWAGIHECLCCPDPCYEPRWVAAANNAFFVSPARPVTQTMFRWDFMRNYRLPDRAEYLWARADGNGKGPRPQGGANGVSSTRVSELMMYTEVAAGKFSAYVGMPYREVVPLEANRGSGFGDLQIGTKSMLFDCELMQVTFQMNTSVPTGSPGKGAGTGHVALEPSLLTAIKLTNAAYLQTQISEWLPIGGDSEYQASILHYHTALNYSLEILCDVQFVMSAEFGGYRVQGGRASDPVLGTIAANSDSYLYAGPGARLVFCNKLDIGFGAAFALTNDHFAEDWYRFELRWRF